MGLFDFLKAKKNTAETAKSRLRYAFIHLRRALETVA